MQCAIEHAQSTSSRLTPGNPQPLAPSAIACITAFTGQEAVNTFRHCVQASIHRIYRCIHSNTYSPFLSAYPPRSYLRLKDAVYGIQVRQCARVQTAGALQVKLRCCISSRPATPSCSVRPSSSPIRYVALAGCPRLACVHLLAAALCKS